MTMDKELFDKPLPEDVVVDIRETLRLKKIMETAEESGQLMAALEYGSQASMMLTSFKIAHISGQISQADFDDLKAKYYVL